MCIVSYAQDFERQGGLYIYLEPASTETVNEIGEFLIKDPLEQQSGLDISKGVVLQGIPNASYGRERIDDIETGELGVETVSFESYTPANGLYKLTIVGSASGKYYLDIDSYDVNFTSNVQKIDGATYPGKIDNYEITYSSVPGSHVTVKYTGSSSIPVFDGKGRVRQR